MWHEQKIETIEAYALGFVGFLRGVYVVLIKEPLMELRLNNQSIETDNLSDQAREDLARSIAFNRDAAIGQLATLGLPADHPYEPKVIEGPVEKSERPRPEHRGFGLGH